MKIRPSLEEPMCIYPLAGTRPRGKTPREDEALDAVDVILPAGTLSGAPKLRACEIIKNV